MKMIVLILTIILLTSCKAILYKKDACGNYPNVVRVRSKTNEKLGW